MPSIIIPSMTRVYIASPFRTNSPELRKTYLNYLDDCIRDSLLRNEAPYVPHAYLPRFLADSDGRQRNKALSIGTKFLLICQILAVYKNHGITEGMQGEIDTAKANGIRIEFRSLY